MKTTLTTVKWVVVLEGRHRLGQWMIDFSSSSVKDLIWLKHFNSKCKIVSGILKCIHVSSHVDYWQSRCFFFMEFILISNYHIIINSSFDLSTERRSQMPKLHFSSLFSSYSLSTTLWPAGLIHGQPAHKQYLKQTDKAQQWKADGEGRIQIEEATTCKHDIVDEW